MKTFPILIPSVSKDDKACMKTFGRYFNAVELDLPYSGVKPDLHLRRELVAFHSLVKDSGMGIYSVHLRGLDLSNHDKKDASSSVALCNQLGTIISPKLVVVHPGRGHINDLLSNLEFLLERTDPGIQIAFENLSGSRPILRSSETLREFVELLDEFPERVGVCIDTSHINEDPYTESLIAHIDAASSRLIHLHLSDWAGTGKKHLPIGSGVIDWRQVKEHLSATGYQGKAAIEIRSEGNRKDDMIRSACRYYGCSANDLNHRNEITRMAGTLKTVERDEIIATATEMYAMPASMAKLIAFPSSAHVEEGEHYKYFVVPSKSFSPNHPDPYLSLSGDNTNLGWAEFLFGFHEVSGKIHIVLIDKKQRIAVEALMFNIYDKKQEYNWTRMEDAIKASLEALKRYPQADHTECTFGQPEVIEKSDPQAW